MTDAERIAREAHDRQWPSSKFCAPDGTSATGIEAALLDAARCAFEAGRATSDLERRALEACESLYSDYKGSLADLTKSARNACAIGRESLAAKKGPWRVENHAGASRVLRDDPAGKWIDCEFFGRGNVDRAEAECARLNAEWVREQNEREASRV